MFNQHFKNTNIKLKHTKLLKKISSALLATLLLATSLPISNITPVYAGTTLGSIEGSTRGTTSGSGVGYDTTCNIGTISGENVRCYIYNKQTGEFVQGTYQDTTFDAIDFAGATTESWNLYSQAQSSENVSNETAFGTVDSRYYVNEWPFIINNETKYFCKISFKADTDSDEICEWLKADNAENLAGIVEKYWGTDALNQLRRDPNLMFCTEPLMVVSSVDDNGSLLREKIVNTHWKEEYYSVYEDDTDYESCHNAFKTGGAGYYTEKDSDGLEYTVTEVDEDDAGLIQAIANAYIKNRGYSADEAYARAKEVIKYEYDSRNFYTFVKKRATWDEVLCEDQHYDYICATGRFIKEYESQSSKEYESGSILTSELGIPSYYNVPNWLCNAVFTDGIGDAYKYNDEYDIVFSEGNRDTDSGHPTFNGNTDVLKIDDTMTSYGISIFAPGAGGCIWHTNDYLKNEPSEVPRAAAPGGPNESLSYGNNAVVKIYETRDRNTGKLIESKSFCSALDTDYGSGIPDTISIEDELDDKWVSEKVDVLGTEVDRTWVKWMSSKNIGEFNSDGEVKALGSGYIVEDWCTGLRSWGDAFNLISTDNSKNGGYALTF